MFDEHLYDHINHTKNINNVKKNKYIILIELKKLTKFVL